MPDTITIELPGDKTEYGRIVYGDAVRYQCRVEQVNRLVRDQDGRERVSNITVYLATTVSVPLNARVTLADGRQPSIMSVESVRDEDGSYFTKLST